MPLNVEMSALALSTDFDQWTMSSELIQGDERDT